ncbi:hypothetical protein AAFF_G00097850 [Aldrovandia affinis]|uniref:Uncharacterized protein n=1 Tax=Aldrovandia affinis TaxID=143900 RepID=A0AAD7RVD9_9TELE|nr:hypothetical protein AAFF_G00097850 [Aldrovandia affinis]
MEFFFMPECIRGLVSSYFKDLQMCFALQDFTIGWQQLEVGIAMGWSISPILFVAAFEIILIGSRQMVRTGRKWKAQVEVDQAISRLQHLEVVGRVQAGQTGLGWGEAPQFWSKANRKEMVVSEVTKMEEERYKIKAVSQGRQGGCTTWEGIVSRLISWLDLWKIPQA